MKTWLSLTLFVLSLSAEAVVFDVIGPCSKEAVNSGSFKTDLADNLGKISMDIFDYYKIPYVGSELGMSSILNSPTGLDAIEVLSDTKMRAYGWCFSVNGMIPDALTSETFLAKQNDYVSWFYAYSTYDQGVWTDYCVPSHKIKAPQFCK